MSYYIEVNNNGTTEKVPIENLNDRKSLQNFHDQYGLSTNNAKLVYDNPNQEFDYMGTTNVHGHHEHSKMFDMNTAFNSDGTLKPNNPFANFDQEVQDSIESRTAKGDLPINKRMY